jgi:hypothetical protein
VRVARVGGKGSSGGGGIAERAFHPDELRADPSLCIDAEYYLAQQVLPVVVRLCAPIEVGVAGGRGWLGVGCWPCLTVRGRRTRVALCWHCACFNCLRPSPPPTSTQGTHASHLAQCLGLDSSRYGHASGGSTNMAAALREEALQVRGCDEGVWCSHRLRLTGGPLRPEC